MAYTKSAAHYDEIRIDGTDVSNAFRQFGLTGENTTEDVTGFSATGNTETIPGVRTQGFTGEAFYTPEIEDILYPIFNTRDIVQVQWTPDGLNPGTPAFNTYYGNFYLNQFEVNDEKGAVRTLTVRFDPADANGIQTGTAT